MSNSVSHLDSIVALLIATGRPACLAQAEKMDKATQLPSQLHLRDLDLNASETKAMALVLAEMPNGEAAPLRSISFSYNPIGDEGAIALAEALPRSIQEIGLVGCGIGETGGVALPRRLHFMPHLKMACLEQNQFSAGLKGQFRGLGKSKPGMLIVV